MLVVQCCAAVPSIANSRVVLPLCDGNISFQSFLALLFSLNDLLSENYVARCTTRKG